MRKIVTESNTNIIRYVIDTVFAIITFILAARFILKLFEVDNSNGLVDFVYSVGAFFAYPFKGIVDNFKIGDNLTFDSATMIALVIIILLYWLVIGLFPSKKYTITKEQTDFME